MTTSSEDNCAKQKAHNRRERPLIGQEVPCKKIACKEVNCLYQHDDNHKIESAQSPPLTTLQSLASIKSQTENVDLKHPDFEAQKKENVKKARRPRKKRFCEHDIPGGSNYCEPIIPVLPPTGYQIRHRLCDHIILNNGEPITSFSSPIESQLKHQLSRIEVKQEQKLESKSEQKQNLESKLELKSDFFLKKENQKQSSISIDLNSKELERDKELKTDSVLESENQNLDSKSTPEHYYSEKNIRELESDSKPHVNLENYISTFSLLKSEKNTEKELQRECEFKCDNRSHFNPQDSISNFSLSKSKPKSYTILEKENQKMNSKSKSENYSTTKKRCELEYDRIEYGRPHLNTEKSTSGLSLSEPKLKLESKPKRNFALKKESHKIDSKNKCELQCDHRPRLIPRNSTSSSSLSEPELKQIPTPNPEFILKKKKQKLDSKSRLEYNSTTKNKNELECGRRSYFNSEKSTSNCSLSETKIKLEKLEEQSRSDFALKKENQNVDSKSIDSNCKELEDDHKSHFDRQNSLSKKYPTTDVNESVQENKNKHRKTFFKRTFTKNKK